MLHSVNTPRPSHWSGRFAPLLFSLLAVSGGFTGRLGRDVLGTEIPPTAFCDCFTSGYCCLTSIALTFGITACTFGMMTLFGYTTKRDLTKMGSLLIMALFGFILASVVNIFLQNDAIYWVITFIGILIFIGLIAYDTQKIKRMALQVSENGLAQKASILGALALYLDFINLFLLLLRLFGRRR